MATTVAQHQLTAVATPVDGGPLSADVVRGNDNAAVAQHNAHDADTGVHVQSSALASRPAFGTAGRKWMTIDSGVGRLWYDTGAAWVEVTSTTFAITNGQPGLYDAGNSGASPTIDWDNGPVQLLTITANCNVAFINHHAGATYTLILKQDGTGGWTVTLGAWDFGDNLPTYNTAALKRNVVSGLYDGAEYLAAAAVIGGY